MLLLDPGSPPEVLLSRDGVQRAHPGSLWVAHDGRVVGGCVFSEDRGAGSGPPGRSADKRQHSSSGLGDVVVTEVIGAAPGAVVELNVHASLTQPYRLGQPAWGPIRICPSQLYQKGRCVCIERGGLRQRFATTERVDDRDKGQDEA